jgi:hypothetical protein
VQDLRSRSPRPAADREIFTVSVVAGEAGGFEAEMTRLGAIGARSEQMQDNRHWTEADVQDTIRYIKENKPGFWEKLKQLELEGAGYGSGPDDPGAMLYRLIYAAHPTANTSDHAYMVTRVRVRLRAELGFNDKEDLKEE